MKTSFLFAFIFLVSLKSAFSNTIKDKYRNPYNIVLIGCLLWNKEKLNTSFYWGCNPIQQVTDETSRLIGDIITFEVIPRITSGALNCKEADSWPFMLQGDHGPIEYRNIIITPAK
jgi:hypothetical protein